MALSEKDIARLYSSLELPIVAGEALEENHLLDPDEEYAFHEALSDMQPDAALLCMALCMEEIYFNLPSGMMEADALLMEADRIIGNYGGLWLVQISEGKPVPEEFILEALKQLPDDHRKIRELIADLNLAVPADRQVASQLLGIMQTQAEANVLIAETHLEALGIESSNDQAGFTPKSKTANDNCNGSIVQH